MALFNKNYVRVWLLLSSLFGLPNAAAFDFQQHRIICHMAYAQLTPKAQQGVDAVVSNSPFASFAAACSWPDEIKQNSPYKHTKPWHYINVPRTAMTVSVDQCPVHGCVLSALTDMQTRLEKNANDWQALLFLSHFMGDLHQPLHVSYAEDLGGNKMRLQRRGKATNLHKLWDGELLKRRPWQIYGDQLWLGISVAQAQLWRVGSTEQWATESLLLTQEAYRLLPISHKINENYVGYFAPKLEQQLQKASVRLAQVLEKLYG